MDLSALLSGLLASQYAPILLAAAGVLILSPAARAWLAGLFRRPAQETAAGEAPTLPRGAPAPDGSAGGELAGLGIPGLPNLGKLPALAAWAALMMHFRRAGDSEAAALLAGLLPKLLAAEEARQ